MIPDISRAEIASLLTEALGQEKATEVVNTKSQELGFKNPMLSWEEARQVIKGLAGEKGLVGVVARFVIARGDFHRLSKKTA